ncbi:L-rhamnose mutarotase [Spongiimicrobium sp. 3-5]|uniref:L-rhamnose mutarotase n=1 Tax=Spongiimicrobium sp. 3-5 TaxID=3332596 RepID=UPI00397F4F89
MEDIVIRSFKMKLKPGFEDIYKQRHDEIWEELKVVLKEEAGILDYAIFFDRETNVLFAYQKLLASHGKANLSSNPIVKKWWDFMADCMEVNVDNSPRTSVLVNVFWLAQ